MFHLFPLFITRFDMVEDPLACQSVSITFKNMIGILVFMHILIQGGLVDFPPSKLKAGSGEHICYVLDRLAEEVLKKRGFVWRK